jgi:glycosyltransferase involved in cell wall biosynthesis
MRIALISPGPPPVGGGIGAYTEKTSRALATQGHDVHVIVPGLSRLTTEIIDGVRIHRVPTPSIRPHSLARSWAVNQVIRSLGPLDIVQACEWEGEAWWYSRHPSAPLVTRLATPHFVVERKEQVPWHQRSRRIVRRLLERSQTRHSARVISPSRVLADEVADHWRLDKRAVTIVPTGIRLPRARGPLPEGLQARQYLLYFGRLERRKGVDTWIEALPTVLLRYPAIHAVFVGQDMGVDGTPVQDLARRWCTADFGRLHFLPALPQGQLFPIVAGARMVIMPSRFESLANSCLEAMALGRPVVATLGTGFAEMITDSVDGFLVPAGEPGRLAEKVCWALADPTLLARVSRAARRRATDFDLDRMVDRLVDVYEQVATKGASIPSSLRT